MKIIPQKVIKGMIIQLRVTKGKRVRKEKTILQRVKKVNQELLSKENQVKREKIIQQRENQVKRVKQVQVVIKGVKVM